MFTNPLDNVRIASPCRSDWNQMYGDDRTRFCSECKLNVYNLSGMSRAEAESLLINSEGRLCVRFFRRSDGTVLTKDCPVGWQALKKRVSTTATALASLVLGFFAGIFSVRSPETLISLIPMGDVPAVKIRTEIEIAHELPVVGEVSLDDGEWMGDTKRVERYRLIGRVTNIQGLEDVKVKTWIK